MLRLRSLLRAGLLLGVAAVSVANLVHNLGRVAPVRAGVPTAISPPMREEARFAGVRGTLATLGITGTIGYIGDLPHDPTDAADQAVEDYYLAQYSLAPLVLDPNADACAWAVASLH